MLINEFLANKTEHKNPTMIEAFPNFNSVMDDLYKNPAADLSQESIMEKITNSLDKLTAGRVQHYLKDAVVFFINEDTLSYTHEMLLNFYAEQFNKVPEQIIKNTNGNELIANSLQLSQRLPYPNLVVHFTDSFLWIHETPINDDEVQITINSMSRELEGREIVRTAREDETIKEGVVITTVLNTQTLELEKLDLWPDMPVQNGVISVVDSAYLNVHIVQLMKFLDILSCKNIRTSNISPPPKLQKKWIKNNHLPLRSYKILEIETGKRVSGKREFTIANPRGYTRLHSIMGHYKTYTAENPLFGKFEGKWWWSDKARGSKEAGIIEKDYSIGRLSKKRKAKAKRKKK